MDQLNQPLTTAEISQLLRKTLLFIVFLALAIFLPAWTLNYWQGWLFFITFSAITVASALYFVRHDPALVRRRSKVGAAAEKEPTQKAIMTVTSITMIATLT